jgi:glycosidase
MKSAIATLLFLVLTAALAAQVSCDPVFPTVNDDVTITFHAAQGNGALAGISPVYAHMGVLTSASASPTDWKYVATTWGIADPKGAMQSDGPNSWKKTFNIRTFFNIPAGETVRQLAFVFRNANGTIVGRAADGSDIFYPVYPENGALLAAFIQPTEPLLLLNEGQNQPVRAAASKTGVLRLFDNQTLVADTTGKTLQTALTAGAPGVHDVAFVAAAGTETDTARFRYLVPTPVVSQDPPADTEWGIQHLGPTRVRLSLYAPNKQAVYALGDFSDWTPLPAYQMKRSADGNTWWIELDNLTPGTFYRFQYLVDGVLKIADPLSTLVLDPWNDAFIPPFTFPNRPPYPSGRTTGIVSVFQTDPPAYNWKTTNYTRPKKADLIIYELHLRDFIARHDYQTLLDTLDYLERLGVTAIECMPVSEFDGNLSWGYNPAFHKALDKYYGDADALKALVDECHARGIAVILDVVFNQATGASPLAQLYWDAANNRPAAANPWLNPVAKHDFNVFYDFNHESQATKTYIKNCLRYWIEEFRVDGFRFDLSKGFTQKNTLGNTAAWGGYDASRVAIWKDYADFIWTIDPENYVILEHFAENQEEKELAEYGMMLWGNLHFAYKEVALGYTAGIATSLNEISHKQRGWSVPHLVGYMESHDEQRIAFECLEYGNTTNANHNTRSLAVALRRMDMLHHLLLTVPGPKMIWQFGELGYNFPINYCPDGTVTPDCRTAEKPIRWDFLQDPLRRRLYDRTAALLYLRKNYEVFETSNFTTELQGGKIRRITLESPDMQVLVIANVGVTPELTALSLPGNPGRWYEYYTGDSINWSGTPVSFTLQPAEYRVYTDRYAPLPPGFVPDPPENSGNQAIENLSVVPNPIANNLLFDLRLGYASDIRVEVFDFAGRLLATQAAMPFPAGVHRLEIDAAGWSKGMYLLRVTGAGGSAVQRFLKIVQ